MMTQQYPYFADTCACSSSLSAFSTPEEVLFLPSFASLARLLG